MALPVALFLFAVFQVSSATKTFESSAITLFVNDRCRNATKKPLPENIRTGLQDLDTYYNKLEDSQDTICSQIRNKRDQLISSLPSDLTPCFPHPEENYIPGFISEGFSAFTEFLCGNRTVDIFFSEQGQDCRKALKEFKDGEEVKNCTQLLFAGFDDELVLTYAELCFDLKDAQKCYDMAISNACPHFAAFRLLNKKFFRSVGVLCGGGAKVSAAFITTVCAVFIRIFFQ